jgi:hypothetical protein
MPSLLLTTPNTKTLFPHSQYGSVYTSSIGNGIHFTAMDRACPDHSCLSIPTSHSNHNSKSLKPLKIRTAIMETKLRDKRYPKFTLPLLYFCIALTCVSLFFTGVSVAVQLNAFINNCPPIADAAPSTTDAAFWGTCSGGTVVVL